MPWSEGSFTNIVTLSTTAYTPAGDTVWRITMWSQHLPAHHQSSQLEHWSLLALLALASQGTGAPSHGITSHPIESRPTSSPVRQLGQQWLVPFWGLACRAVLGGQVQGRDLQACMRWAETPPGSSQSAFPLIQIPGNEKSPSPNWKHVCFAISLLRHAFVMWQPTGIGAALARLGDHSRHPLKKATQQREEKTNLTWQHKSPQMVPTLFSR